MLKNDQNDDYLKHYYNTQNQPMKKDISNAFNKGKN